MSAGRTYMPNGLRLCIDKKEENEIAGRLYSPLQKEAILFQDFIEMITKADKLFDAKGYPQSFQHKRSFQGEKNCPSFNIKPEILRETEEILNQKGKVASYDVLVISRRHTNWQGNLRNIEGKKLGDFQDILGLLNLVLV